MLVMLMLCACVPSAVTGIFERNTHFHYAMVVTKQREIVAAQQFFFYCALSFFNFVVGTSFRELKNIGYSLKIARLIFCLPVVYGVLLCDTFLLMIT